MSPGRAAVALLLTGCAGATAPDGPLAGEWGGEGVAVRAAAGAVTVELDCAHGSFVPATLADGRFEASGTWVAEGGPVPETGWPEAGARWSGTVAGDRLTLTARVDGADAPYGPWTAALGAPPLLRKCL